GEEGTSTAAPGAPARFKLVAKVAPRSLSAPVSGESVVAQGRNLIVIGGLDSANTSANGIYNLDPGTGALRASGTLAEPLHASAAVLGGRVYVLGGSSGGAATDRILSFDPSSAATSPEGHLPLAVANAAAGVVGGTAYLIGGVGGNGNALASVVTVRLKRVA